MTAIAGTSGQPFDASREDACRRSIHAQASYGSSIIHERSVDDMAFAVSPLATIADKSRSTCLIENSRYLLAGDVRLDNRDEMIERLAHSGDPHCSDAAITLLAWSKWNEKCLAFLAGDFAFVIYDRSEKELVLVRDPTGQRPIFFSRQRNALFFSTMPSGIAALLPAAAPDLAYLARQLLSFPNVAEDTLFEGIERVRPGEHVQFKKGSCRRTIYWNPECEQRRRGTDEEFCEGYRHLLDTAIRSRLPRTPGPVASHLSSGYDSSAVTATAAHLLPPGNLIAFTAAPLIEQRVGEAAVLLEKMGYRRVLPAGEARRSELESWHRRRKESVWDHPGKRLHLELHGRLPDSPWLIPQLGIDSPRQLVEVCPVSLFQRWPATNCSPICACTAP